MDEPERSIRFGVWCLVVGATIVVWTGCSVEKHYEVLSFFFDGVPNPNALPVSGAAGDPLTMRNSPTYTIHQPFKDDRCSECHGTRFETGTISSQVCLQCHADVTSQFERMHGPVVAVACLWCHVSHESAHAWLMKDRSRTVCGQCHEPQLLNVEHVPAHAEEDRSCLECHHAHGGASRHFLRDTVAPGARRAGER